ncbi:sensor histidine kinase [Paractinoplanes globisporus]|uniref:Sensor histidine kinase n=1 Tax=Paractinoplanes globisporus TaxID=113565 RepID=A0ABW6WLN5_9ACTN|nr:ATP-binding protein [Actinoplanes globisporus]
MGVGREVAAAALARAVLIGRATATVIAAAAGLLLVHDRRWVLAAIVLVLAATAAQLAALGRWPGLVTRPALAIAVDSVLVLAVLAVSRGSVAYFCFAAGAGAVAGVLLGLRALPVWAAHAALGFTVIAEVLRRTEPPVDIMAFVVAFPMAGALAGVGAAVATTALTNQIEFSTQLVASAQRSAAASERARLARELHDSVTKTLRGVSLAALALPSLLRRQPALAEHLASTVVAGATAAAQQARELLEEMRFDVRDLAAGVDELCRAWSASSGIPVRVSAAAVDPPDAVAYELTRILREALANVARHGHARWVEVRLAPQPYGLTLEITDDGVGFAVPDDLAGLQSAGHFGIVGMDERARAIGGVLRIASTPGSGTRITVNVPSGAPVRGHRRSIGAR